MKKTPENIHGNLYKFPDRKPAIFDPEQALQDKKAELTQEVTTLLNQTSQNVAGIQDVLNAGNAPDAAAVSDLKTLESDLKMTKDRLRACGLLTTDLRDVITLAQDKIVDVYRALPPDFFMTKPVEEVHKLKLAFDQTLHKTTRFVSMFNLHRKENAPLPETMGQDLAQALETLDQAMNHLSLAYNHESAFIKIEKAEYDAVKTILNQFAEKYEIDITPP